MTWLRDNNTHINKTEESVARKMRTDEEIVSQTNEMARIIYASRGYEVAEGTEFHTDTINRHPYEIDCWDAACKIQELLTSTDPNDAVDNIDA